MSKEAPFRTRVDRYFRREDTALAEALKTVCPLEGEEYRNCKAKRVTGVLIAAPIAAVTAPVVGILALAAKVEDGGSSFYIQERVMGEDKTVPVAKIRCMKEGSDNDTWAALRNAVIYGEAKDPRNTRLGRFMRQYELEELPQVWQVMKGQLALVDIRATARYVIDYIKKERPESFGEWWKAYISGKPGLFSLNTAVSEKRKDDRKRHHLDIFYSRKASLGLDLFILYRTGVRMWLKLRQIGVSKSPART
jgi:lipopolysaccharide/colanic/teichoic acid biosynthesis glycosyltransferase